MIFLEPLSPFLALSVIFVLSVALGFFLIWRVTPALHSPLMALTNAVSSVIILGGLLTAANAQSLFVITASLVSVFLCIVNIVGGFLITHRMLNMFQKTHKGSSFKKKTQPASERL
jgi:NAD(P) transhydrogenase subunit alpha